MKKYYDILGISEGATLDEIKKAYRKRIKETHPDNNLDNPNAKDMANEVQEAYSKILDYLKGDSKVKKDFNDTTTADNTNTNTNTNNSASTLKEKFDFRIKKSVQVINEARAKSKNSVVQKKAKSYDMFNLEKRKVELKKAELDSFFKAVIGEVYVVRELMGNLDISMMFHFFGIHMPLLKHFSDDEKKSIEKLIALSLREAEKTVRLSTELVYKCGNEILNSNDVIALVSIPLSEKFTEIAKLASELDFDKLDRHSSELVCTILESSGFCAKVSSSNFLLVDLKSVAKKMMQDSKAKTGRNFK